MKIEERGNEVVITLAEKSLYWFHSHRTRQKLFPFPQRWAGKTVWVDMRAVEMMSGDGVGTLVGLWACLRKTGGRLILCNPNALVFDIFQILKLDRQMEIVRAEADPCVVVEA